ncbi:MAG: extracellular solute-binding protein [Eggerthellaceae bacterium]|jgi:phosphate transport system substrate-binding protein|nr:extracellular solute-binding protein [Eggerthellaceae bacterium]MDR2715205.1 extracellular solute-binding protein [Coriobacteriaceae bacterium]
MNKKLLGILVSALLSAGMLFVVGCTGSNAGSGSAAAVPTGSISVYSREDGSGTRGAFIELFEIQEKDASGNNVDMTTLSASITNSTSVMMTSVSSDTSGIGYISLGSLNNTVKALDIDGAQASATNVKSGTYKISRPFNIATKSGLSPTAQDFVDFIMSADGQKIVEDNGYVAVDAAGAYAASDASGKVVVAGSSSVTPIMEKLAEAYKAANPKVTVEVQQSDSTTGMNMAMEGTCDIGMASRDLKDSETSGGLSATVIAIDGLAVIVSNNCGIDGLSSEQVKSIFTGEATTWEEALG